MNARIPAIGTLRDRVQILNKSMAAEAEGGHSATYLPLATVWARVRALSGTQNFANDGRTARGSHAVVLRFRSDVSPGDRVVYRGENLEVISAEDLNGRRAYLSCVCTQHQQVG